MGDRWSTTIAGARTLVEVLAQRAAAQGGELAYTFLEDGEKAGAQLTFDELDRHARAIAARLHELVGDDIRGARTLLLYPSGLDFIAAFLGSLYAGAVAVPAYPPASKKHLPRLQAIARDSRPAAVLADSASLPKIRAAAQLLPELHDIAWLATDTVDPELGMGFAAPPIAAEDLAFLQYTSGSTAAPKGVMVSHGNLMHNEHLIQQQTGHGDDTVFVGWLPLYHDMGLIGNILQPLYLGIPCYLMSPVAFLQRPLRWLEAIDRHGGTTSGGPNFGYELCVRKSTPEERRKLDLSSWNLAYSGSEPVQAETLERFAAAFAESGFRSRAFYPCYGMAETTLMISGARRVRGQQEPEPVLVDVDAADLEQNHVTPAQDGAGAESVRRVVGCGTAGVDFDVVIADPETRERLTTGQVGEIWVQSPSVAGGYWQLPEITERDFRARLESGEGPYLRTGDLGYLDDDGELFVTGRLKDLIIIRGRNHYPQDIELAAGKSHPALRPGCGIAVSTEIDGEERLIVVHEIHRHFKDDPEEVSDAIRQAVAATHQVQIHDVVLIAHGSVPKTSSGKLQRQAALAEYRSGALKEVAHSRIGDAAEDDVVGGELELDRATLEARSEKERRALVETFLRAQAARLTRSAAAYVDPERALTSQGLDSLTAVEIKNAVDLKLGVELPLVRLLEGASIQELLPELLKQIENPAASVRPKIVPGFELDGEADPSDHPLSHGQEALWYLHRLAPDNGAYNIRGAARLDGDLDVEALHRAAVALVERHAALRTCFVLRDERPRAVVSAPEKSAEAFEWRHVDATGLSREELDERLADEIRRPFDLAAHPVFRLHVFVRPGEHLLLVVLHHIVGDFWSLGVLMRELGELYGSLVDESARVELEPLPLTYADFARWQRALIAGPEGERLLEYWRGKLGGDLPLLDLPTDRPRPAVQSFVGDSRGREIGPEITARLEAWSSERGVTLFVTLAAALETLLYRWSRQSDVVLGVPTTQRGAAELEALVGYFVNPVALRGDLSGDPSFSDFLDQTRQDVLGAFAHQEYPFPLLVEGLDLPHDPSRSPVFQVMLVWQQDRLPEERGLAGFALGEPGAEVALGPLVARSVRLPVAGAQFDLSLELAKVDGCLLAAFEYNTDLFEAATADRFLSHFETLLASIAAVPGTRLSALQILTAAERRRLIEEINPRPVEGERRTLHDLIATQALTRGSEEALIAGERRLTYRQLIGAASRLAHRLVELGVGPETRVGVCMERDAEMIVALLAVLQAGGAYVPLDPEYPAERLAFTLEDSRVGVLLVHGGVPEHLPAGDAAVVDLVEYRPEEVAEGAPAPPAIDVDPHHLAYLIYTSGSTGRPKGVAITHRSAAVLVGWSAEKYREDDLRGVLAATSICFDLSIFEIFVTLGRGGRVILARNALELPRLPAADEVTLINTVPSAISELVAEAEDPELDSPLPAGLGVVNLAGEPLPRELVERLYRQPGVERVCNLYGPSEDTTYSTYGAIPPIADLDPGAPPSPSIGHPIAGTQAYLLDVRGGLVPYGVRGELFLGGDGLARGYLGRPSLTAERFVPDPFSGREGERLYRTGDLARYRADGELEFLGRLDHQVKVRGFRIELGEIEAALLTRDEIREAVVLARGESPDDRALVAYVVAADADPDLGALRHALGERLPAFMVPQVIMPLAELPLLPNGKIDRKALPAPAEDQLVHDREFVEPSTEVEEILAEMWREVLGVERIGIYDSFFDLGGHSLKATRVLARVREAFGVDLPVRALLEAPTIAGLTEAIAEALLEGVDEEEREAILAELGG